MLDRIHILFARFLGLESVTAMRRRERCPRCHMRLKNVYKRAGKWRCHRCWMAAGAKMEGVKKYA